MPSKLMQVALACSKTGRCDRLSFCPVSYSEVPHQSFSESMLSIFNRFHDDFLSIKWQVCTVRYWYAKVVYTGLLVGTGKEKGLSFDHQCESFWCLTVSGWQWSWYSQNLHTLSESATLLLMLNRDISSTPSPFYSQAQTQAMSFLPFRCTHPPPLSHPIWSCRTYLPSTLLKWII